MADLWTPRNKEKKGENTHYQILIPLNKTWLEHPAQPNAKYSTHFKGINPWPIYSGRSAHPLSTGSAGMRRDWIFNHENATDESRYGVESVHGRWSNLSHLFHLKSDLVHKQRYEHIMKKIFRLLHLTFPHYMNVCARTTTWWPKCNVEDKMWSCVPTINITPGLTADIQIR